MVRRWIAAGFGVGFLPRRLWGSDSGAGTFGAALAAIVSAGTWGWPWWAHVGLVAGATAVSLWAAAPFSVGEDPPWVVVDEIAGTLLAGAGLVGWPWLVAVAVARLADIFKVLPGVGAAERLGGAVGVTLDDLVAGAYGLVVGWTLTLLGS